MFLTLLPIGSLPARHSPESQVESGSWRRLSEPLTPLSRRAQRPFTAQCNNQGDQVDISSPPFKCQQFECITILNIFCLDLLEFPLLVPSQWNTRNWKSVFLIMSTLPPCVLHCELQFLLQFNLISISSKLDQKVNQIKIQ